ncbi:MAG: hypothetical protein O8C64_07310 [Candidatus Methanoperedens sp.]|nr:hypothetical protein [Candidatus Methanoperedens sp.]MCZ7383997.1 hypothetical protein [Candidatus Methanoperedens sp.]
MKIGFIGLSIIAINFLTISSFGVRTQVLMLIVGTALILYDIFKNNIKILPAKLH